MDINHMQKRKTLIFRCVLFCLIVPVFCFDLMYVQQTSVCASEKFLKGQNSKHQIKHSNLNHETLQTEHLTKSEVTLYM
jgi:hypothetical protein